MTTTFLPTHSNSQTLKPELLYLTFGSSEWVNIFEWAVVTGEEVGVEKMGKRKGRKERRKREEEMVIQKFFI